MASRYGNREMPLAGAILCCTSIPPEQRTSLANTGAQMGAVIKLDLTSDVTHLIVGNTNSAKYRYVAKSREDVKVLKPEWMEALRLAWITGEEVNTAALEQEYRLPTFYQLKICLTGFDDPDQRKFIQDTVAQHGADYHGDLTKAVTHLIAAAPTGKKYEHAVNWRMKVVSYEWFLQSLERGMALDESYFLPTIPVEERGKGAWDRRQVISPSLKRTREPEPAKLIDPHRRKLRRSASTKLGSQSEALWAGITAVSQKQVADDGDWTEQSIIRPSLSEVVAVVEDTTINQDETHVPEDPASDAPVLPLTDGLFQGRIVFTFGFDADKTKILRDHLASHNATVIQDPAELFRFTAHDLKRGYLVVPAEEQTDLTSLPGGADTLTPATNWWVERCLHSKSLVDPTEHVLCRPVERVPIGGFEDLTITSTAFIGIELLHVSKVVPLMGAKYDEYLSVNTSVLVCNTAKPNPEKLKYATRNQIPAVHAEWLWDCLRAGKLQPFGGHTLNVIDPQRPKPSRKPQRPTPTVAVPAEDNANLRKTKPQAGKPAAEPKQRNGNMQRGLDLAVSAASTVASKVNSGITGRSSKKGPFVDDDDDDEDDNTANEEGTIPNVDGPASIPLQDIPPSVNSPRRPSTSSSSSHSSKPIPIPKAALAPKPHPARRAPTPDSIIPPPTEEIPIPEEKDYSVIMTNILARGKAAAEQNQSKSKEDIDNRKRRRQLGRATSNPSSNDALAMRGSEPVGAAGLQPIVDAEAEAEDSILVEEVTEYQPSQELGWDAPGAQEAREKMIRAMGGKVEGTCGGVVEGIGVLKDMVGADAGVGRAGRRKRH